MIKITFITQDGEATIVSGTVGTSIMELAKQHNIKGIDGDCGGVCSCATCHVHVAPAYFEKVGKPSEIEADMLELDDNVSEFSRLGCQMEVTEAIGGISFRVAN